jgi:hypothetical protein
MSLVCVPQTFSEISRCRVVNALTGVWQFPVTAGGGHVFHGRGITPHHPPLRVGILPFGSCSEAVVIRNFADRAAR